MVAVSPTAGGFTQGILTTEIGRQRVGRRDALRSGPLTEYRERRVRYTPSVWIDAGPVATTPGKKCSALILTETVCDLDSDGLAVYDRVGSPLARLERMF